MFIFFFQAEDGIRDLTVTGVQTCALPILEEEGGVEARVDAVGLPRTHSREQLPGYRPGRLDHVELRDQEQGREERSEERRVGKECRSGWAQYHEKKNKVHIVDNGEVVVFV